jgi:hypothetical protein
LLDGDRRHPPHFFLDASRISKNQRHVIWSHAVGIWPHVDPNSRLTNQLLQEICDPV